MEATGFCGMEVATRGLVGGSGSSSPPELDSPGCQEHVGVFELVSGSCSEEVRGETPGREDCPLDPNNAELDPGRGGKIKDQKGFGKEVLLLMQALTTLASPEEKLAALCKKYADSLEESRSIQKQVKVLQKKQSQMVKEKIHLQSEHSKAILARSKLESLCRELQRHNKTLKMTLNQIEVQMEQHNIHNSKLRQENMELAQKLKKLIKQYELREEHIDMVFCSSVCLFQHIDIGVLLFLSHIDMGFCSVLSVCSQHIDMVFCSVLSHIDMVFCSVLSVCSQHIDMVFCSVLSVCSQHIDMVFCSVLSHIDKVFKHKEKQQQLVDAKLQRTAELMREVEGKQQRERDFLLKDATESRHECELMKEQETQLKQQMTKKIKKLEKETTVWRTKWETNNQALLQMAEEKTLRDKHYKGLHGKLERLEKLCQALQMERDDLTTKLGELQSTTTEEEEGPPDPQPNQESTQDELSPPGRGEETQPPTTPELEPETSTTEQLDN
ncbi:unnamed protein product [Coregonus sp. 'balchen']|nr:unnamed protein product [Coregonus sp. 'balchen']